MSFIKKNLSEKPSLVKPVAIVVAIILVIGGVYSLSGKKSQQSELEQKTEENVPAGLDFLKGEIKSSGLDKNKDIDNVGDVEEVIVKWVEANPQAILQSVANMQQKMMQEQMQNAQKNIGNKKEELFNDQNSPQYAPENYDVTIVEFFDYSCGYCKKAQATLEQLLKEDKKVRVVYKEFPILGQPSHEVSQVALAVNMVSPSSYKKFHDALMKGNERGKDGALKVAKSVGINAAAVEAVLTKDADKISSLIQANLTLGNSIGINGTPGFVIGEELVPGALELSTLKEKIAAVRAKK
ncbi:MAG: hypothetical protein A2887_00510 [Alphaproteobacteria bacterium RIFCSPLOWO2_01_FULL_40_26]|nr:MAG: hypothetical protein A3D15_00880 [Alphaproteobacteria bacterium RIFCSPHIGHO2_02_FULL_40_34]OFW85529.1 MAG: hypothetical protein A2794_05010 [Alphaproteobacteria bacterium RIFCSPHIGHO2_01_FULL_40_8]OFW94670.1 MAG: hypothetical protein A2887_00510 [Alphaproteobacteria bacterium RIFCSPLOWO2_01_FULL_40_26]OFX10138.1 MAG: hypothetical protein A3H30_04970 [Alphaproteobacteria bacterium RIFCSPLOWO2_02_FULL_40_19]OFX11767.1 MAG: hypothetical protein A3G22_04560 [Alphaproteobacteria bacterium RI